MITATRSPLHTALCDRLGIRYPICQAGTTSSSPRERSGDGGVHAHGPDNYKQKIAALDEEITVVTRAVSGKPNRQIRNVFTREWEGRQAEIEPFPVRPAGRVVASIVEKAEAIFRRLGARGEA